MTIRQSLVSVLTFAIVLSPAAVFDAFGADSVSTSLASNKVPAKNKTAAQTSVPNAKKEKAKALNVKPKLVSLVERRIDGMYVKERRANRWPVAVMIDNFPTARPQAGLDRASVVYEALAEGGIPRFMAVFAERGMPMVGPVRSARPYFVQYAMEYTAAFVHAGGSDDAQELLKASHLVNIEGIKGKTAKYFYRGTRYYNNVHDLFTTGDKLQQYLATTRAEKLTPNYRPWRFINSPSKTKRGKEGQGVTINLGAGSSYIIDYRYDPKQNAYLRFTGGKPHLDRITKQHIAVKNVLLLRVPKEKVLDYKGRLALKTLGSDRGVLFQNGKAITIRWNKRSNRDRTIIRTLNGKEADMVRGSTWITIVPRGHSYRIF